MLLFPFRAAPRPRPLQLGDLPDEVLLLIFRAFPAACEFRAHAAWRAAAALGATSARFRALFRASLRSAAVPGDDSRFCAADVEAAVRLGGDALRSLCVARPWVRLCGPAAALAAAPPPLLARLTLTQLSARSNLHPDALAPAVAAAGPSLRELRVGYLYPVGHLHTLLDAVAQRCGRLEVLATENLWVPPHVHGRERVFAAAWEAVGGTLRVLSLLKAQEPLCDKAFLQGVAMRCGVLEEFAADGDSFPSPYILSEMLGSVLGPRLRSLVVRATALCDMDAATLLSRCGRLTAVALVGTAVTARTFRRLVAMRGGCLERLEVTHVADLADEDVAGLADAAPHLRELRLRRCARLTDDAFPRSLCARLEALDVRDCPEVGDATLHTLAAVQAPLKEIMVNESRLTEGGVAELLRGCGATLVSVDMRFKSISRGPMRERIRKFLSIYCRSGVLQNAGLE